VFYDLATATSAEALSRRWKRCGQKRLLG